MAAQLICNQWVAGSTPVTSSKKNRLDSLKSRRFLLFITHCLTHFESFDGSFQQGLVLPAALLHAFPPLGFFLFDVLGHALFHAAVMVPCVPAGARPRLGRYDILMPADNGGVPAQDKKSGLLVVKRGFAGRSILPGDLRKALPAEIMPPDDVGLLGGQLV